MYDLITIGNISIDLYFKGDSLSFENDRFQLAIGGKYTADTFYEGLGGGGANVAIGATKLGLSTAIVGKIGKNPFEELIVRHLHTNNVSCKLCTYKKDYYKISSILLSPSGERSIINYETPHEHIFESDDEFNCLLDAKIVYLSNLPRVALAERVRIMTFLHKHQVPMLLNLGIVDCRRPLEQVEPMLKKTSILLINAHEFAELAKIKYEKMDFSKDIRTYIPALLDKIVVITDGKKGSYGYFGSQVVHMKAEPTNKIIDTTGAGDGYTAGFIAGYLKYGDPEKAMQHGAKYAVKIIEKLGAN